MVDLPETSKVVTAMDGSEFLFLVAVPTAVFTIGGFAGYLLRIAGKLAALWTIVFFVTLIAAGLWYWLMISTGWDGIVPMLFGIFAALPFAVGLAIGTLIAWIRSRPA